MAAAKDIAIAIVVAVAENGVIGRDGGLPWHIPADLREFKRVTMGKPIVMGRRTYESIGRPLPGRANIVVSRDPGFGPPGVTVVRSVAEALEVARFEARTAGAEEICIIGGAAIFAEALPMADILRLTEVHAAPEGDVRMPAFSRRSWRETARQEHSGDPAYSFITLERIPD